MKMCRVNCLTGNVKKVCLFGFTMGLIFISQLTYAQNGEEGIKKADSMVRGYFKYGTNLMYAVGAIVGLIGAVKVYNKWNSGDPDTGRVAASWFGSCIFLVVVALVIRSFFGITE